MRKKNILFIATTAENRNRLDGETIKCRLLKEYVRNIDDINILSVDTDNWKKHVFKLTFLILIYYFISKEIIISSADNGAYIVLNFFEKIRCKKKIYYFVIGGSLYENIKKKKWNVKTYQRINHIYVEAQTLKNDLEKLKIQNVILLNNFRKINNFKNKYKFTNNIKLVYYGRVIKEKGIEEAIKLTKKLNEHNINCILDIYGQVKNDYLKKIEQDFNNQVTYCGEIKPNNQDEYEILSQYDIFIFPTEYPGECLPGALIDCYIAGLAVIASNWKYAKEYILDNENGKIFEYKNYDDMYKKTLELIKSGKIEEYKKKSLELSKKYNIEILLINFKRELVSKQQKNENS